MKEGGRGPVVILYSECLSSYLLYGELVDHHPELIDCLVELPAIPSRKPAAGLKAGQGRKESMLARILKRSSVGYLLLNVCTVSLYRVVSMFKGKTLKALAESRGVPVHAFETIDEPLHELLRARAPAWLLNNSPNILRGDLLAIPTAGCLNFHPAPLPEFRGAGNYFWVLHEQAPSSRATLHYVVPALDAGEIIEWTEPVPVERGMTVFRLWYELRLAAWPTFRKHLPHLERGERLPSTPQDESRAIVRSFPDRACARRVRQLGHPTLSWHDLRTILRIAWSGRIPRQDRGRTNSSV